MIAYNFMAWIATALTVILLLMEIHCCQLLLLHYEYFSSPALICWYIYFKKMDSNKGLASNSYRSRIITQISFPYCLRHPYSEVSILVYYTVW